MKAWIVMTTLATAMGVPVSASANWLATCQSSDGLCQAQACGSTPQASQQACFDQCSVDPGLFRLGSKDCNTSVVKVRKYKTPRPKRETFKVK